MKEELNENPIIENEEIETQDKLLEYLEEEKNEKIIDYELFSAKNTAPFSIAIDKAMHDNKQGFLDFYQEEYHKSGLVVYDNSKHKIEIVFTDHFAELQEEFKNGELLGRSQGLYNTFAEKLKDIMEEKHFELFGKQDIASPVIIKIKDTELADMLGKSQSTISRYIDSALKGLSNIRLSYIQKGKGGKKNSFFSIPMFSGIGHEKGSGTTIFSFNPLYMNAFKYWGFTQYPKELKRTNDKNYPFAYEIGKYVSELLRTQDKPFVEITFRSIFSRVTKIPSYEEVSKTKKRNYQEKIYEPLFNSLEHLRELKVFDYTFNDKEYLTQRGYIDYERLSDTKITFTPYNVPNYARLNASREEAKKEANKIKNKMKKGK